MTFATNSKGISGIFRFRLERHDGLLAGLQVLELDHAVRVLGLQEPSGLKRDVLAVAIATRNAV